MNLKIKLIDKTLPPPEYKTKGAVAFDIYSRIDMKAPPFVVTYVPTNLIVKVPKGYFLLMAGRSSLPKNGLILANGIGIFDQDFCGEEDEMKMIVLNFTKKTVKIEKGQRLCQAMLVKISQVSKFIQVKKMSTQSRGGIGSTGKK